MDTAILPSSPDYPALTSDIVSAYISHNSVPRADLIALIASVHAALTRVSNHQGPKSR
jgi:predicted transcriptional regulator